MKIFHISWKTALVTIALILAVVIGLELKAGRVPVYAHGPIALWAPDVKSDQNSQQIADWYTPSHLIHGFAFYGALSLVPGGLSIGAMAVGATIIESAWEVLENSPLVIDRYRAETVSVGYQGDSVLNSVCDILACLLGFYIASKLPWQWTVALVIIFELLTLYLIRDNLTLNVLMLVSPVEAIKHWQAAL